MKTLPNSWKISLNRLLDQLPAEARLALVGVGNELRADDAAGVLIIRNLLEKCLAGERILLLEGGSAPENATAQLRRFKPHLILFIDAAALGAPPGSIQVLDLTAIDGLSASTHTLPLSILARYLTLELGCQVALLGIQPASIEFGAPVSASVIQAVEDATAGCVAFLHHSSL
jgi:hydrogenase 3 maturation protease